MTGNTQRQGKPAPSRGKQNQRPATQQRSHNGSGKTASEANKGPKQRMKAKFKLNIRGFGFAESLDGDVTWFCPPNVCRGMMDQDIVDAVSEDGDVVTKLYLVERTRERVVGEVRNGELHVDAGVGQNVVIQPETQSARRELAQHEGKSVWWDLERQTLIEALGSPVGERAIEVRMYERHMIDMGRSKSAEREAAEHKAGLTGGSARRDMRDELIITIDAAESQDLDDALSARVMNDGSVRVWVHIADVSEHVKPGSAIDEDAKAIPTSVYTPQRVRHMLPEALAGDVLSLVPAKDRDTLCCEMSIDAEGNIRSVDVYEALIRSRERVTYIEVGEILAGGRSHEDEGIDQLVRTLHMAAARLSVQRAGRGGVDAWRADEDDHSEAEGWAHDLIERLMVAANESVSEWLEQRGEYVLYRAHPGLTTEETQELDEKCREIGLVAATGANATPKSFAALALMAKKAGREMMFWDAAMGVMPRARYQVEKMGHFGLGSRSYCHFTSPLRRYADLLVHRSIKAYLRGERGIDATAMQEIAGHINETNRRADACERDSKRAVQLRDIRRGEERQGMIIGRQKKFWRVQVDGGVMGNLPVREDSVNRIGETVQVVVKRVEALIGVLDLAETASKN